MVCIVIFYKLFPYLLNYPPGSINTAFQLTVNPTYYWVYYFSIFTVGSILELLIEYKMLKPIQKINNKDLKIDEKMKIRKIAYTFPNKALILTAIIIPVLVIFALLLVMDTNLILTIKIGMLSVIFLGIPSILMNIIENRILKRVLTESFNEEVFKVEKLGKSKLSINLMLQIFPIFVVSMVILFMFVIANMTEEFGDYRFDVYKQKLDVTINNINNNKVKIKDIPDYMNETLNNEEWFVRINNVYHTSEDTEISEFVKKYMEYYSRNNGGRLYDDFGVDNQGVVDFITIDGQEVTIGILYSTVPNYLFINILSLALFFMIISFLITYLATNSVGNDLKNITEKFSKIAKNKKIQDSLIPVTAMDERGQLTIEFNNVQINTVELYEEIQKNQEIIALQAKFTGIGELASGMAHDINNPASSLETSINLLKEFEVLKDKEDYELLVNNMQVAVNKILMVVNNTSEQFRNHSKENKENFSLKKLLEDIDKTEKNNIIKNRCKLNITMQKDIVLYGTRSKMYQVLVNLIRNSVLAYKEHNKVDGTINIFTFEDRNYYTISIEDMAGGIPEEIRDSLFNKVLSTRGVKGTGLGLYLAGGIIRGEFKGDITFETETNKGTVFYIKIPKNKEEN